MRQPDDPGVDEEEAKEMLDQETRKLVLIIIGGLVVWFLAALMIGV